MKRISGLLLRVLLSVPGPRAYACSMVMPDADAYFRQSGLVVMALPVEISPSPEDRKLRTSREPYAQVVKWQVLYRWKGNVASDTQITTSRRINPDDPCVGWDLISGYEPRLIYASGEDPYTSYYTVRVSGAHFFLQSLQHQIREKQVP